MKKKAWLKVMHFIAIVIFAIVVLLIGAYSFLKHQGNVEGCLVANMLIKTFVVGGMLYSIPYAIAIAYNQ